MYRFLDDLTVLDLSETPAGAYAGRLLAHYGADVIKVESPQGDPLRKYGPFPGDQPDPERSGLFLYLNADKRGITLDLTQEQGQALLREMASKADAIIESFSPGTMARWGLGEAELRAAAPHLVVTSISPFGQDGPYRDYRANDLIAWAASGAMVSTGDPEREPLVLGHEFSTYATGALAAIGTLGALFRDDTRQSVDVSLVDGMMQLYGSSAINRGATGGPQRGIGRDPLSRPQPCANGFIGINPLSPQHWPMFCAMAGVPELVDDPRFGTSVARATNAGELEALIRPWMMAHTKEEIFDMALEFSLPAAFVTNAPDVLAMQHHRERKFFEELPVDGRPPLAMPAQPVRFSEMASAPSAAAPKLGQHNDDVFGRFGYQGEALQRLREEQVI